MSTTQIKKDMDKLEVEWYKPTRSGIPVPPPNKTWRPKWQFGHLEYLKPKSNDKTSDEALADSMRGILKKNGFTRKSGLCKIGRSSQEEWISSSGGLKATIYFGGTIMKNLSLTITDPAAVEKSGKWSTAGMPVYDSNNSDRMKFVDYINEAIDHDAGKPWKALDDILKYVKWYYPKEVQDQMKDWNLLMAISDTSPYSSHGTVRPDLPANFDRLIGILKTVLKNMINGEYGKTDVTKAHAKTLDKLKFDAYKKFLDTRGNSQQAFANKIQEWMNSLKVPAGFQKEVKALSGGANGWSIELTKTHPFTKAELTVYANFSMDQVQVDLEGFYSLDDRPGVHFMLGQRGISSFDYVTIKNGKPGINDLVKKILDAITDQKKKLSKAVRVKIGATTFNFTDMEKTRKSLYKDGTLRVVPSGMGVGYTLFLKPVRGARRLDLEAEKAFGISPIYFESFDYD
jgi:hypothetical protein